MDQRNDMQEDYRGSIMNFKVRISTELAKSAKIG